MSVKLDAAVRDLAGSTTMSSRSATWPGDTVQPGPGEQVGLQSAWREAPTTSTRSTLERPISTRAGLRGLGYDVVHRSDQDYSPASSTATTRSAWPWRLSRLSSRTGSDGRWQQDGDRVANDIEDHDSVAADALQLATQVAIRSPGEAQWRDGRHRRRECDRQRPGQDERRLHADTMAQPDQADGRCAGLLWQSMIDSKGK